MTYREILALIAELTLEEKASLLSGKDLWSTKAIERLHIPSIFMTDGPHGLRKSEGLDIAKSVPATCFPTASALASSWNTQLAQEVGQALGKESQENNVQVLLGPGINMKRSPLGGRNFEYFSEDPVLSGYLASAYIDGVQGEGVGVSLKHFAANNQEFERMKNDSRVDSLALHEIYLRAFEIAVKKSQPWSVMMSYNLLNGTYSAENGFLMQTMLRESWGFKGITISDWGAVNDPVQSVRSGLNLEMPGGNVASIKKIVSAVKNKTLTIEDVDRRVSELLKGIFAVDATRHTEERFDREEHNELARRAASESIVLLKNKDALLPLSKPAKKSIGIIGEFAKSPRYQGAGSSRVTPTKLTSTYSALEEIYGSEVISGFAKGYEKNGETTPALLSHASTLASESETVLLFVGLPGSFESEGFDRSTMDLPKGHTDLIDAVTKVNERVVVILMNGSAVSMPWVKNVNAIIEGWLSGQAAGGALADIISGAVNPSGKLSETFPVRIEDTPPFPDFPGKNNKAMYREGQLIGYRFYDVRKISPLFAFGHGLSYTTFSYSDIRLSSTELAKIDSVTVTATLKNTGSLTGKEVTQLYVYPDDADTTRPLKALKSFSKTSLEPKESTILNFVLTPEDFATYDIHTLSWVVRPGVYKIGIGGSSDNLPLQITVTVLEGKREPTILTRDSMFKEFADHPRGKFLYTTIVKQLTSHNLAANEEEGMPSTISMLHDMPVSRLVTMSQGVLSDELLDAFITYARHPGSYNPLHVFPLIGAVAKLAVSSLRKKKSN